MAGNISKSRTTSVVLLAYRPCPYYSWAVVGHPYYRFLFIMSRKPHMDKKLYDEIVARCKSMGRPVEKLVSQRFPHALE